MLSRELQAVLDSLPPHKARPAPPAADDFAGWRIEQARLEERARPACERALAETGVRVEEKRHAGMDALWIVPPHVRDGAPAIFIHGGGYTGFSARSSLFASAPMAVSLARPLISLDYPLAPHAGFRTTVPAASAAVAAICAEHDVAAAIGDSAGGGLALAAVRGVMRAGARGPRALVLISPWTDLTCSGDSHRTHAARDPILACEPGLRVAAEAYAAGDLTHPDASPLHADFGADFPPTLVLCGTEEILLSDALRLHKVLQPSGAELIMHEGLFHSFVTVVPNAPESAAAREQIRRYCQDNHTRFYRAFDAPPAITPPPSPTQIPSVRAGCASRDGSADASGC